MGNLLLVSIVIAHLVAPIRAARRPRPWRALGRMMVFLVAFDVAYAFAVTLVYVRYFIPEAR